VRDKSNPARMRFPTGGFSENPTFREVLRPPGDIFSYSAGCRCSPRSTNSRWTPWPAPDRAEGCPAQALSQAHAAARGRLGVHARYDPGYSPSPLRVERPRWTRTAQRRVFAGRKPIASPSLIGKSLSLYAERTLAEALMNEPPRSTRTKASVITSSFSAITVS